MESTLTDQPQTLSWKESKRIEILLIHHGSKLKGVAENLREKTFTIRYVDRINDGLFDTLYQAGYQVTNVYNPKKSRTLMIIVKRLHPHR